MRTQTQCLPCFIRQAHEALRLATPDKALREAVLRRVLTQVATMDLAEPPPALGQRVHRLVRELTNNPDPYRDLKRQCNRAGQRLLPSLRQRAQAAESPFDTALRLAIAGNVIDFGVDANLSLEAVGDVLEQALHAPLDPATVARFTEDVVRARSILYLADNTGEIYLDRLFLEQLPCEHVTLVVRGGPILNDALREDAREAGLEGLVTVIDNGSDAPGTLLDDCGAPLRQAFREADLIVAKGQGNYESLHDAPATIYFLLKAKCPVTAALAGAPLGDLLLLRSEPDRYASSADRL